MKQYIYALYLVMCLGGCSNKAEKATTSIEQPDSIQPSEPINIRPKDKHIPLYAPIDEYNNNLSDIASEIHFVKLSNEPLLKDFLIADIQCSDEYIFLQGMGYIYQYNLAGNFIKQIGSSGQGPGEYINLSAPIQLDRNNKLIYANDLRTRNFFVYNFDGTLNKAIYGKEEIVSFTLLDSATIAIKTSCNAHFLPHQTKALVIESVERKPIKSFKSYLYPVSPEVREHFGPDVNPLWQCRNDFYMLEYGNDTIYQVTKDSLIPSLILTGELTLDKDELFKKEQKNKILICGHMMKPESYVFESDRFIIFRMVAREARYFAIYDKKTGHLHRTGKQEKPNMGEYAREKDKDYFIDNLVSNMAIIPLYQSNGMAIGIISAMSIIKNKDDILNFIAQHPTQEGESLKKIIENIEEEDNSILCFIRFK